VIVVGCESGEVFFLKSQAKPVYKGKVSGRPLHTRLVQTRAGPLIALATDQGEVATYRVTPPRE
jgi:hypothetical protein